MRYTVGYFSALGDIFLRGCVYIGIDYTCIERPVGIFMMGNNARSIRIRDQ